eukprot:ANDGO_08234.mRNA.1 hypothetical protein
MRMATPSVTSKVVQDPLLLDYVRMLKKCESASSSKSENDVVVLSNICLRRLQDLPPSEQRDAIMHSFSLIVKKHRSVNVHCLLDVSLSEKLLVRDDQSSVDHARDMQTSTTVSRSSSSGTASASASSSSVAANDAKSASRFLFQAQAATATGKASVAIPDDEELREQQERLLSDIRYLTKELARRSGDISRHLETDDLILDRLEDVVDRNLNKVKKDNVVIRDHSKKGWRQTGITWGVLLAVTMLFVFMYLFMKIFPKRLESKSA